MAYFQSFMVAKGMAAPGGANPEPVLQENQPNVTGCD